MSDKIKVSLEKNHTGDKMKVRQGDDGYSYPYTSPDLVVDKNGKSNTTKFTELENKIEKVGSTSIDDTNTATDKTWSSSKIDTQFKDIANNQPTDLSLDSATNLLQLVNSKGSKLGNGITLPISSGGGTSQYLHIKYSSTGAPQLAGQMSDTPNAYIGLSVDTNADSPTNPRSYTWYQWKGDNGAKGDTGATPNLQIGTVTTLDSGSNATASITGTTENPVLNLGIPRGNDGASGTGGNSEGWELIDDVIFEETVSTYAKTFDKEYDEINIFLLNLDSESISDSWSNLTLNPSNGNINIRTGTVETNKGLFININRLGNHYIYYVANNVMTSSVLGANIRLFYGLGSTSSKIKGLSFGSSSILKATNRLIIAGR